MNQAVGNLDQMTQQNAALVEESAAAAQSLREQAEQLAQVVSMFGQRLGMPPAVPVQRGTPVPSASPGPGPGPGPGPARAAPLPSSRRLCVLPRPRRRPRG